MEKQRLTTKIEFDDSSYFDNYQNDDFLTMSYQNQIKLKEEKIKSLFLTIDKTIVVSKIVKAIDKTNYRHKVVLSAFNERLQNGSSRINLGLFIEGTKKIKPVIKHIIHDQEIEECLETILIVLRKYKIKAYDNRFKDGIIKHILIRKSYHTKEMLLVFVTQGRVLPNHKLIIKDILGIHKNIVTVIQNIHFKDTKIVLLEEEKVLYGNGYIFDRINDLTFRISSRSFYQVNPRVMFDLYNKALEIANITKNDIVLDCYSGIGTISLLASKLAKVAIGVEVNKDAVKDAIFNKKYNNIDNAIFVLDDVTKYIMQFNDCVDCLIIDPTRLGSSMEFLSSLKNIKPKKIIYISCNVETQIRDIKELIDLYKVKEVIPFDMFPYTSHAETIVLLELKK